MNYTENNELSGEMVLLFEREYLIRERQIYIASIMYRIFFAGACLVTAFFVSNDNVFQAVAVSGAGVLLAAFWIKGELDSRADLFGILRRLILLSENRNSINNSDHWIRRNYIKHGSSSIQGVVRAIEPAVWLALLVSVANFQRYL